MLIIWLDGRIILSFVSQFDEDMSEPDGKRWYAIILGAVIQMAVVISVFAYGGSRLDEYMDLENPWFTILGSLIGVSLGLYLILRLVIRKK